MLASNSSWNLQKGSENLGAGVMLATQIQWKGSFQSPRLDGTHGYTANV